MIERKVYAQVPPKVEYSLSALGRSMEPILLAGRRLRRSLSDASVTAGQIMPHGRKADH
jgi:DNA-binding HxlR family transcriptional regulator